MGRCAYYQPGDYAGKCLFAMQAESRNEKFCLSQQAHSDYGLGDISALTAHWKTSAGRQAIMEANRLFALEKGQTKIDEEGKRKSEEELEKAIEALQRFIER